MNNVFERYARKYDVWYDKNKLAYLSELEAVRKFLPKKGRGLEIGVGTGRFAAALNIEFGVDPSPAMLKKAKVRGVKVRLGVGERLPFGDSVFDYAAIIISICFMDNPRKVFKEAKRVLKKNGKLIVGIIDKNSFLGRLYRKKKSVFYRKVHFYGAEEISKLFKEYGFKRISYLQTIFSSLRGIVSVETPVSGFGRGGFVVIRGTL